MYNKIGISGILLILLSHQWLNAQVNASFSDYFDQFYNNYYLLNTACADSSHKVSAIVSDKTQTGLFQGVNKLYLDLDIRKTTQRGAKHFFGIQAINNKEGEFISKNRCLLRYSLYLQLSYRSSISGGFSAGFVNYSFNTSQSGSGGSDWVPDANAGIWYLRRRLSLGISIQQILNQKIQPANQIFVLGNYYTITARYFVPLNNYLKFYTHFYTRLQRDQPFYFVCVPMLEIQQLAEIGASYSYQRGISYVAGLKQLNLGNSKFSFYFSYFVGVSRKGNVSDNAFELLLIYQK